VRLHLAGTERARPSSSGVEWWWRERGWNRSEHECCMSTEGRNAGDSFHLEVRTLPTSLEYGALLGCVHSSRALLLEGELVQTRVYIVEGGHSH
jgi:hypothetical protein